MIEAGQPIYLWVSGSGHDIEPGVWGYGHTTGPCEPGISDKQWLDESAAAQATYFAAVEIDFLTSPVKRTDIKSDPRLGELEVLRVPAGSNPSFLTNDQAAAMLELTRAAHRGACPRCGSGQILHVVFGLPAPGAFDDSPPWVTDGGCVIYGHPTNRYCPACELDWLVARGGRVQVRKLHELRDLLGRATNADLENGSPTTATLMSTSRTSQKTTTRTPYLVFGSRPAALGSSFPSPSPNSSAPSINSWTM